MKIVLDSNVIIAGIISEGVCHRILSYCSEADIMVVSPFIKNEVLSVMKEKFNADKSFLNDIDQFLNTFRSIEPSTLETPVCRDSDDDNILSLAIESNAPVIFTGDKDLLILKSYKNISLCHPNTFWDYIE